MKELNVKNNIIYTNTLVSSFFLWLRTFLTNLYLSVSSADFYYQIYKSYRGYGVKYVLTLSFFAALICCCSMLERAVQIRGYFKTNLNAPMFMNIDHIISQFPDINYDGQNLELKEETPIYLTASDNTTIIAIDPDNKLRFQEKARIPVILTKTNIIIPFFSTSLQPQNILEVNYSRIFGNEAQTITQEIIRAKLADIFDHSIPLLIYLIFPTSWALIFTYSLFEKGFIIIIVYFLTQFMKVKTNFRTCVRLVLFANGAVILLKPVLFLLFPVPGNFLWLLQAWTHLLMTTGILRATGARF